MVRPSGSITPQALMGVIGNTQPLSLVGIFGNAGPVGIGSTGAITFTVLEIELVLPTVSVFEYLIIYVPTTVVFTVPVIVETNPPPSIVSVQLAPSSIYVSP